HHEGDVAGEVGVRGRLPGPVADDGHDAGHARSPQRPRGVREEARLAEAEERLRSPDAAAGSPREAHRPPAHSQLMNCLGVLEADWLRGIMPASRSARLRGPSEPDETEAPGVAEGLLAGRHRGDLRPRPEYEGAPRRLSKGPRRQDPRHDLPEGL